MEPVTDNEQPTYEQLVDELANFREMAEYVRPSSGEIPCIEGIEIAGMSMPLKEGIGGDHLIYIDFKRRYNLERRRSRARSQGSDEVVEKLDELEQRAGILLADVSGHRMTDALLGAMLHQAFLVGVHYELDHYGEITTRIFEHINTRFYHTTSVNKYFTMIYGEISRGGRFRFISAGHQPPMIYSRQHRKFADITADRLVSFPPVGLFPPTHDPDEPADSTWHGKEAYSVNEISLLAPGDILLLLTDGLTDHARGEFFPEKVVDVLREHADFPVGEICEKVKAAICQAAAPEDDISLVLIRRTR